MATKDLFPEIDDGDVPDFGLDEAEPEPFADQLNEPQATAASHVDGPMIVFAGAGSGKTRVITYRIANLCAIHRVPPYRILAVTFTNKAAAEMRRRLEDLIGHDLARDLWVGTFHAVCARLLRTYHGAVGLSRRFVIYDDGDQRAVVNRIYKDLKLDERRYPPKTILGRIHRAKQEGLMAADFRPRDFIDDVVVRVFGRYEEAMGAADAVDFDDLLIKVARLTQSTGPERDDLVNRFRYVLVDEFQDVNMVQYELVRGLTSIERNLCVVGDDDQSIYKWRGADVRIIRNFRRDHPTAEVVKLEQNYRSTANIVASALAIIRHAREREPKELFTEVEAGEPVRVIKASNERDEAAWVTARIRDRIDQEVSPAEIAVFYRMHAQSRVLEEVMRSERIPYQVIGGVRFFERAEIKDLLSYLRILRNPQSDVDFTRIVNVPPRKIGDTTVERLTAVARENKCSLLAAIQPAIQSGVLGTAAKKALAVFHALISELSDTAETAPPSTLAEEVLERTGYLRMLEEENSLESEGRVLNLEELIASMREYEAEVAALAELPTIDGYLERVSLSASGDESKEGPRVSLMTVHAAKGLEFTAVFVTGLEEETFPYKSQDPTRDFDDDEERRLMYVAVTRARQELFLTHVDRRMMFGMTRYCLPSRFLGELPENLVQRIETPLARQGSTRFIDRPYEPRPLGQGNNPRLSWARPSRREDGPELEPGSRFVERDEENGFGLRRAPRPTAPSTSPSEAGARFVERDEEAASGLGRKARGSSIRAGQRVFHKAFGRGVVQDVDGAADATATVRFSGWEPKRIKVRFLQVEEG